MYICIYNPLASTKKPKVHKIAHVFKMSNSKVPDTPTISNKNEDNKDDDDDDNDKDNEASTTKVPKTFNIEEDRQFLSHSMFVNRNLSSNIII